MLSTGGPRDCLGRAQTVRLSEPSLGVSCFCSWGGIVVRGGIGPFPKALLDSQILALIGSGGLRYSQRNLKNIVLNLGLPAPFTNRALLQKLLVEKGKSAKGTCVRVEAQGKQGASRPGFGFFEIGNSELDPSHVALSTFLWEGTTPVIPFTDVNQQNCPTNQKDNGW